MNIIKLICALWQAQQEEAQAMADLQDYLNSLREPTEEDMQAMYAYMLMCEN